MVGRIRIMLGLQAEGITSSVDFSAFDIAAENEHGVGVSVIGAPGTVFAGSAAKLRHGDKGDVFCIVAKVAPEGSDACGEIAETVGELAVDAALVLMCVPTADVGESSFYSKI